MFRRTILVKNVIGSYRRFTLEGILNQHVSVVLVVHILILEEVWANTFF